MILFQIITLVLVTVYLSILNLCVTLSLAKKPITPSKSWASNLWLGVRPQWLQNSEPLLGLACLRSVDSGRLGRRWGQATITLTKWEALSTWFKIIICLSLGMGIASPTLYMLRSTKVAVQGIIFFNQFLCNILLSKTKTKTKMGVTSYPKELAAYKWHQITPLRFFWQEIQEIWKTADSYFRDSQLRS
jgi:hypothetical protein